MKTREFVRKVLVPAGAKLRRKDADHHVYLLPNGRELLVPMGGSHTEMKPYLLSKFRRLMREEPMEA